MFRCDETKKIRSIAEARDYFRLVISKREDIEPEIMGVYIQFLQHIPRAERFLRGIEESVDAVVSAFPLIYGIKPHLKSSSMYTRVLSKPDREGQFADIGNASLIEKFNIASHGKKEVFSASTEVCTSSSGLQVCYSVISGKNRIFDEWCWAEDYYKKGKKGLNPRELALEARPEICEAMERAFVKR